MKSFCAAVLSLEAALDARADEGMWLFKQPPRQILMDRYQFDATDQWLDHIQKSSVRFNSGGSGSFVSEDGLLISNRHIGADALQKLSTPEKNYLKTGFYARTLAEEIKSWTLNSTSCRQPGEPALGLRLQRQTWPRHLCPLRRHSGGPEQSLPQQSPGPRTPHQHRGR
jgi:hypothetical protein